MGIKEFMAENNRYQALAADANRVAEECRKTYEEALNKQHEANAIANEKNSRRPIIATDVGVVEQAGPTEHGLAVQVINKEANQRMHYGGLHGICVEEGASIALGDLIGWV